MSIWCNTIRIHFLQISTYRIKQKMPPNCLKLTSGYEIPIVGMGTSKVPNEEDLECAINAALEIGYRHIDTASIYNNEHIIGRVLKNWLDSGRLKREDLFITTKLNFTRTAPEFVETSVLESLEKLQLDYVDLYLIHFPVCAVSKKPDEPKWYTRKTDHLAIWKELEKQVDAGRIRSLGVSNFNETQLERLLKSNCKHKLTNNQVELHVYLQQRQLVEYCQKNGVTVTAFGPLGSPGYNDHLKRIGKQQKPLPNILNDQTVRDISEKHSKAPSQVLLRFLIQNNIIVIPKSVTPSRLKENFDLFSFNLDERDMEQLRSLDIGEDARVFCFSEFNGLEENEEWPFIKQ